MAGIPTNRGVPRFGATSQAPLPTRVQADSFGARAAAPAGGTLPSAARPPQARPSVTTQGAAQGRESFTVKDGKLDAPAVARALNTLQANIALSTAQARANPLGNGVLFQNVLLSGTLCAGSTAQRPFGTGLPDSFQYYDLTLAKPLWFYAGSWIDAAGVGSGVAASGDTATTNIDHGFGAPAVGFLITNVQHAVLHGSPRIVLAGTSEDNNTVRIWAAYAPLSTGDPTADFYVFR